MQQVLPGVWDWQVVHESIGFPVHSHLVGTTLVDPMVPEGGLDALPGKPERIVLSNRHHDGHAERISGALGIPVLCHRDGLHEFEEKTLKPEGFGDDGEEVVPGMYAYVPVPSWPGDCVLHVPDLDLLVIADTLVRDESGDLSFVPDQFLGDDAEEEKAHLGEGLKSVVDLDFDHILMRHGPPWIGGARVALRDFLQS
jgi:hypothetical protein